MRFQTLGDKPEFISVHVRNDAGASIPKGTPVVLSMDGTEDGLAVVLPSGAADQAEADRFCFGIVPDTLASNKIGEAIVFGVVREAIVIRQTRTASTDTWAASVASSAIGAQLGIETVNNALSALAAITATASISNAATSRQYAWLAQTLASFATDASTASSIFSGTVFTVLAKVFVRML